METSALLIIDLDKFKEINAINKRLSKGEDGLPPITCSVGVAFGQEEITASEVFKRADEVIYK